MESNTIFSYSNEDIELYETTTGYKLFLESFVYFKTLDEGLDYFKLLLQKLKEFYNENNYLGEDVELILKRNKKVKSVEILFKSYNIKIRKEKFVNSKGYYYTFDLPLIDSYTIQEIILEFEEVIKELENIINNLKENNKI